MYARSTTIITTPDRAEAGIAFVTDEVMPTLLALDGCVGVSMLLDRAKGVAITTSAWRDEDALWASDAKSRPLRARGGEIFGAAPSVDVWEIAVLHRNELAGPQACVRSTWSRTEPANVERAIGVYRDLLLPQIEEMDGFLSASLFVDRTTGLAVSSVTVADEAALASSRETAVALRRSAVAENDIQIVKVAEFDLVLAHLRVPETI